MVHFLMSYWSLLSLPMSSFSVSFKSWPDWTFSLIWFSWISKNILSLPHPDLLTSHAFASVKNMGPSPAECLMWNLVDVTLVVLNWILPPWYVNTKALSGFTRLKGSILPARILGWRLIVEGMEFCRIHIEFIRIAARFSCWE